MIKIKILKQGIETHGAKLLLMRTLQSGVIKWNY